MSQKMIWQVKDKEYAHNGELGPKLNEDGTCDLRLWSPSAEAVNVVLYHPENHNHLIGRVSMEQGSHGTWEAHLDESHFEIQDYRGYFYHYEIIRLGESVMALDPYAKSLSVWNHLDESHKVAKAAIVEPSQIGPELQFAQIPGYEDREDAIIYEVHVRDFTSDPALQDELNAPFGTFKAFVDKLDYIQSLGVTHIQLLPVLSFYNVNEQENHVRYLEYSSAWSNYNWGYDPQHYFALTGYFATKALDPENRILEFKELVQEIHRRGMGVTLDVVYNHTGRLHILEDLEPEYYHFMNADRTSRQNFGGGRLGSTHYMTRRLIIDSLKFLVEEYKVDGFRFDMMGDLDAETMQLAYDEIAEINPKTLFIGEGWLTYVGDEEDQNVQPADQLWMSETESIGSFSDDLRDELKSGYPSEGYPRFLSGGPRKIDKIFKNIKAQPTNFEADQPGDVVQYIEAHDNMTLHDVLAYALMKDPKDHSQEIHQRIRLGNLILLTSQGTAFIHAGQEYGRTKQFKHPEYTTKAERFVEVPDNATLVKNRDGKPIEYPYFVHDSYNSSDAVNHFDWSKVSDTDAYPIETQTMRYTQGLIHLRRSSKAFRLNSLELVNQAVNLLKIPEVKSKDVAIGFSVAYGDDEFVILVNADRKSREFTMPMEMKNYQVIVDQDNTGTEVLSNPTGLTIDGKQVTLEPLTGVIFKK